MLSPHNALYDGQRVDIKIYVSIRPTVILFSQGNLDAYIRVVVNVRECRFQSVATEIRKSLVFVAIHSCLQLINGNCYDALHVGIRAHQFIQTNTIL